MCNCSSFQTAKPFPSATARPAKEGSEFDCLTLPTPHVILKYFLPLIDSTRSTFLFLLQVLLKTYITLFGCCNCKWLEPAPVACANKSKYLSRCVLSLT